MSLPTAVTVVVPTFNRERLLARAIASVQAQSFEAWKLVVADDGSTDGTADMVGAIDDDRVHLVALPENRGCAAARNAGLSHVESEFCAFLDSDDEWEPTFLERLLDALERDPDAGAARSDLLHVGPDDSFVAHANDGDIFERLLDLSDGVLIQATVFRRSALDGLEFDGERAFVEDRDFFLRVARNHRFVRVPELLARMYVDGHEHMDVPANQLRWRTRLHDKNIADYRSRPRAHSRVHESLAAIQLALGDSGAARREARLALTLLPSRPRARALGIYGATLMGRRGARTLRRARQRLRQRRA